MQWQSMQAMAPGVLQQMIDALPVPRLQAAPQVQAPADVTREPYHNLPAREVESDIARQLNADLQAGTHPTTQALVPLGLRFVKILGAGSQGTAVLFEMDDANGLPRKIVAKYENKEQGTGDSGSGDSGSGDVGSGNTGSGGTRSGGGGSGDAESGDSGSGNSGSGNSGSGDSRSGGSGSGDAGSGGARSGTGSGSTDSEDNDQGLAEEKKWMNVS